VLSSFWTVSTRSWVNKGKEKGRSYDARPFLLRLYGYLGTMIRSRPRPERHFS
jgi:hypothetical protein